MSSTEVACLSPSVVVSARTFASADPYDVVLSNISFVNVLFEDELLREDEVARDAMRSYYADYYLAQVENGGFSQFVWNSRWSENVVTLVREGLDAMGAVRHRALFEEAAELVVALGDDGLAAFLEDEYFGDDNDPRDKLDGLSDRFYELTETEDLGQLNGTWLKSLPHLEVMPVEQMEERAREIGAAVPDRAERLRRARDAEPDYQKTIRALCALAGHTLDRVTAGDPNHEFEGELVLAWHFLTDEGHHFMIETADRAIMFAPDASEPIAEIAKT